MDVVMGAALLVTLAAQEALISWAALVRLSLSWFRLLSIINAVQDMLESAKADHRRPG